MAKVIYFSCLLLAGFYLQGCKSVSGLKTNDNSTEWNSFVALQPEINSIEWKRAQLVAEMGGNTQKSSANIQIIRDSAIHISVQPFPGLEMMKVQFSKTGLLVFNKMNNQRYEASYQELSEMAGLPLDLNTWQAIFLHRPAVLLQPPTKISRHANKENSEFMIINETGNQTLFVDKNNNYLGFTWKDIRNEESLHLSYNDFRNLDSLFFPFKLILDVQNKNLMLKFEVNLNKMTYNVTPELRYEDKNKYVPVPVSSIIK